MVGLRGYAPYKPQAKAAAVIAHIQAMLADDAVLGSIKPVTLRQIFYRLVALHGYPKSEDAYRALGVILTRARRARMIDFGDITDSGIRHASNYFDRGPDEQIAYARSVLTGSGYRLDPQAAQGRRLIVWCEADGLVAQTETVARDYGVDVVSGGGQPSVSFNYWLAGHVAELAARGDNPTAEILMLGDYDPPGYVITQTGGEDVAAFAAARHGLDVEITRIALSQEQVLDRNIITSPFGKKDNRFETVFGAPWPGLPSDPEATAQLEAIAPPELQALVRGEIDARLDPDRMEEVKARQARHVRVIQKAGRRLSAKLGRPSRLTSLQFGLVWESAQQGWSVRQIADRWNIPRSTVQRMLRRRRDAD